MIIFLFSMNVLVSQFFEMISKFACGVKVSRVLAMIIFLFSMNVLVSQFFEMISVVFFIKIDKRKKVAQQTTLKCFKNADNFLGAGGDRLGRWLVLG